MEVVVADETGLVKELRMGATNVALRQWGSRPQNRDARGVTGLCWLPGQEDTQVLHTLRDGSGMVYHLTEGRVEMQFSGLLQDAQGVACLPSQEAPRLVCANSQGQAAVAVLAGEDPQDVVAHQVAQFQWGTHVAAFACRKDGEECLTGGENNLLTAWDLATGKAVWRSKNFKNDFLDLTVPMYDKDVKYFHGCPATFATCTAFSEVRLYDRREQRRAVGRTKFGEVAFQCLAVSPDDSLLAVGDVTGELTIFDARSLGHPLRRLKGAGGSIRCVDFHPTQPVVVSVGLDRFVRLHDVNTAGKAKTRAYMKQRLCKALFKSTDPSLVSDSAEDAEEGTQEQEQQDEDARFEANFSSIKKLPKNTELRKRRRELQKAKERKKRSTT